MSRRDTATKLLVQSVILKLLKAADAGIREEAKRTDFDEVGVREPGKLGDTNLGTVRVDAGARSARVTNPDAFLAWVMEHYPHNVKTVPVVIPSFVKVVTDAVLADGGWPNEETGELGMPPGVELKEADDNKLVVTPSRDAPAAVLEALGVDAAAVLGLAERAELEASDG